MAARSNLRITKRTVDALAVEGKDAVFWDHDLPGFGVRVYASGRKMYVVQSRARGGPKRVTIGRHGDIAAEGARKQAAVIIDRIKQGEDPVPAPPAAALTVAGLAERYLRAHVAVQCKASTAATYRGVLDNYILPELGAMSIRAVERGHVAALHYKLRNTPIAANRAIKILSKMFSLAEAWDMSPAGKNPCRSLRRYKEQERERFLTEEEIRRLGRVLDAAEAKGSVWPHAVAIIRLLMLTGCRRNEIATLQWDDVDRTAGVLRLRDAKTGARMVPLTPMVKAVLDGIPRVKGNPWVIAGKNPGARLSDINHFWQILRVRAGLEDVRIHDLRHTYASRALALGESLTMIGKLLGHTKVGTTARYAHLARDTEKVSAAKVADSISADIMPNNEAAA